MSDRFTRIIHDWGADEAEAYFRYAGYRARNASEPLREAGRTIRRHVDAAFASEGASDGAAWADLKDTYKVQKAGIYGHVYPILHGRGRLRDKATLPSSIKVRSSADGGHLIYSVDSPYAEYQASEVRFPPNPDTNYPGYTKPARPFFVMTWELQQSIEGDFMDWLDDIRAANTRRGGADLNPFRGLNSWL